jgi:hypothetical protein
MPDQTPEPLRIAGCRAENPASNVKSRADLKPPLLLIRAWVNTGFSFDPTIIRLWFIELYEGTLSVSRAGRRWGC